MVDLVAALDRVKETCRLMIGVPDYATYVDHVHAHHPDQPAMSYEEFFKERQDRRYGVGQHNSGRCVTRCC
jgi:uncharacterized short protein YbdD (DUF466 family)